MKNLSKAVSVFTILIFLAIASHSRADGFETQDNIKPKIDPILQPLIEKKKSVGIAVGIIDGEHEYFYGYGRRSMDKDEAPAANTMYEIGSITKVFTATLLTDSVIRGEVTLEDPVQKYLPAEVKVPSRNDKPILLLHLSAQNSGLPRLPTNFKPTDGDNPYADYSVENLYAFLSGHELRRDPGKEYEYSNLGVGLLGHTLALKAGKSYEEFVNERICRPLAMTDTVLQLTPDHLARLAPPYQSVGKPAHNWDIPTLAGAGGLRSTMNDMMKFMSANMGLTETPLSTAMDNAQTERYKINDNLGMALGWHIIYPKDGEDSKDEPIIWHNGGTGGYATFLGFMKKRKLGIILLNNTRTSMDSPAIEILKALR